MTENLIIFNARVVTPIGFSARCGREMEEICIMDDATVEVTGGKGALSRIRQSDIQLFIEYNRFQIEDKDSLEPTVRILQTVQSYQVHPEKFTLKHEAPDAADSAAEEN